MDRCETCGAELTIGSWPFCAGGHGRGFTNVITDDVPGGFVVENGFDAPRKFYSKSEHVRALAEEGCEIRAKWAGPGDRHLKRWDAVSQHTLDAAKAMLSRPRSRFVPERSC